jgi:hypothetical protein
MMGCPERAEIVALIDGELTENRARALRAHVDGCAACGGELASWQRVIARIATPAPPAPGAAQRVLARLSDAPVAAARARRWPALGGLALAAGAALALAILLHHPQGPEPELVARGGGTHSLARDVDVSVYASEATLRQLHDGATVSPETAFAVSYRNLGAPAYAAVFAIDGAGELHWIAPAYLSAASDPTSFLLAPAPGATDTVLADATMLASPTPGALRVLVVVTSTPLHVSEVERLAPHDVASVRARWPDADVRELALDLSSTDRSPR